MVITLVCNVTITISHTASSGEPSPRTTPGLYTRHTWASSLNPLYLYLALTQEGRNLAEICMSRWVKGSKPEPPYTTETPVRAMSPLHCLSHSAVYALHHQTHKGSYKLSWRRSTCACMSNVLPSNVSLIIIIDMIYNAPNPLCRVL